MGKKDDDDERKVRRQWFVSVCVFVCYTIVWLVLFPMLKLLFPKNNCERSFWLLTLSRAFLLMFTFFLRIGWILATFDIQNRLFPLLLYFHLSPCILCGCEVFDLSS